MKKEQILQIPKLVLKGLTIKQIADKYKVHERTINRWIFRLREEGIEVKTRVGARKIKLN